MIDAKLLVPRANQHSLPIMLTAEIEFGEKLLSNINPVFLPVARARTCQFLKGLSSVTLVSLAWRCQFLKVLSSPQA